MNRNCENCNKNYGPRRCHRAGARNIKGCWEKIINPYSTAGKQKDLGDYFKWGLKKPIGGSRNDKK